MNNLTNESNLLILFKKPQLKKHYLLLQLEILCGQRNDKNIKK